MNEQICAWCEKEFGVKVPGASHGLCKRHAESMMEEMEQMMRRANLPNHIIQNKLDTYKQRIDSTEGGAPDMKETGVPANAKQV